MNTLQAFINSKPSGAEARRKLAEEIGVSEVTVRSWANGNRSPSKNHLVLLEEVTEGAVKATDFLLHAKDHKVASSAVTKLTPRNRRNNRDRRVSGRRDRRKAG